MGGSNFPTKLAPEAGQLYSLAGAPAESSLLSLHLLTSLGGPSHCLVPVSHAKSPTGQGGPTGHVRAGPGVGESRHSLASHPAVLNWRRFCRSSSP